MVQCYSAGDSNVSSSEGTLAPPGEYDWTRASFGPPESTTQTANRSVQPFLHSLRQKVPILYSGRPFPPKLPLLTGGSEPRLTHDSLGHSEPTIQTASRSVNPFSHKWLHGVTVLYNGRPFPQDRPFPWGDLEPHLTHYFLGQSESTTQTASWSVSCFCTDDRRVSLYFTMGRPFSPSKLSLCMGVQIPHLG